MKKTSYLTIALAFSVITITTAQDVDDILKNHFETIGQENLLEVNTIEAEGTALQMGMEFPFKMVNKRPDKLMLSFEVQGSKFVQAYDGETVWAINPMSGSSDPVDVTGPEADGLKENADMDGQLWNYKDKGHQLDLEGTEEVDGTECYVLKLTKKNGNIDYYYLDTDSHLILKTKSKTMMQGSEVETEAFLSNYQDMDGYIMPFTTEQKMNGQTMLVINIDDVKVNEAIDDAVFAKPE